MQLHYIAKVSFILVLIAAVCFHFRHEISEWLYMWRAKRIFLKLDDFIKRDTMKDLPITNKKVTMRADHEAAVWMISKVLKAFKKKRYICAEQDGRKYVIININTKRFGVIQEGAIKAVEASLNYMTDKVEVQNFSTWHDRIVITFTTRTTANTFE